MRWLVSIVVVLLALSSSAMANNNFVPGTTVDRQQREQQQKKEYTSDLRQSDANAQRQRAVTTRTRTAHVPKESLGRRVKRAVRYTSKNTRKTTFQNRGLCALAAMSKALVPKVAAKARINADVRVILKQISRKVGTEVETDLVGSGKPLREATFDDVSNLDLANAWEVFVKKVENLNVASYVTHNRISIDTVVIDNNGHLRLADWRGVEPLSDQGVKRDTAGLQEVRAHLDGIRYDLQKRIQKSDR